MDAGLRDRVVLVTGGSGGIGQSIVRMMFEEGAKVVVHFHQNETSAEDLVRECDSDRVISIQADLREEAQVERMFQEIHHMLGEVEVLVANAGVWPSDSTSIAEMSFDRWQATLNVDMHTVFLCVREQLKRRLRCKPGQDTLDPAVVVIGSTAGWVGEAGHADYATAKSGLMYGFVQSLKNEIARETPRGRINAVCPGWTITPMAEKFTGHEANMIKALQTIPLRKFACSEDIASAVTFLASPRLAGHITGQTLFVTGGMEGRVLYDANEIDLQQAMPQDATAEGRN